MSTQFEPQLFSLSARQKADSWDRLRMVLAQAKKLGATNYVFHGAATLGGALKNAGLDRIAPITDEIAELCKTYGVRLCWENVSWCLFNTPEFATQMLARCKSDNLFFCLDIKQAIRSGYHPFEYLDTMGDRLGHVHLLDYAKNGDALNLYMPLEGNFDFEELRRRLCNIGFNGALMLECYSDLYTTPQDVVDSWGKLDEYYK